MSDDERYLRRALALAAEAEAAGDVPVGAVLVSGALIVEARNEKERRNEPTAHAEMLVINEAARRLGNWRLADAVLYVTKEPCVMCAGAIVAARIRRLVYGANDPKGGADGGAFELLRSPHVNHRVAIDAGILQDEAAAQLQRFFQRKRAREPEGIAPESP